MMNIFGKLGKKKQAAASADIRLKPIGLNAQLDEFFEDSENTNESDVVQEDIYKFFVNVQAYEKATSNRIKTMLLSVVPARAKAHYEKVYTDFLDLISNAKSIEELDIYCQNFKEVMHNQIISASRACQATYKAVSETCHSVMQLIEGLNQARGTYLKSGQSLRGQAVFGMTKIIVDTIIGLAPIPGSIYSFIRRGKSAGEVITDRVSLKFEPRPAKNIAEIPLKETIKATFRAHKYKILAGVVALAAIWFLAPLIIPTLVVAGSLGFMGYNLVGAVTQERTRLKVEAEGMKKLKDLTRFSSKAPNWDIAKPKQTTTQHVEIELQELKTVPAKEQVIAAVAMVAEPIAVAAATPVIIPVKKPEPMPMPIVSVDPVTVTPAVVVDAKAEMMDAAKDVLVTNVALFGVMNACNVVTQVAMHTLVLAHVAATQIIMAAKVIAEQKAAEAAIADIGFFGNQSCAAAAMRAVPRGQQAGNNMIRYTLPE